MRSFLLFLSLTALACAHTKPPPAEQASSSDCRESCPLRQAGMQVVYEDAELGAVMAFTGDDVAVVQEQVAAMAQMHNEAGNKPDRGPPHTVRADDTPTGARLIVTPADPTQLEALRAHVRSNVEKIQRGECPLKWHQGNR